MYSKELLKEIMDNRFNYDKTAQLHDIDLFYQYLKCKYNQEEFKNICQLIQERTKKSNI